MFSGVRATALIGIVVAIAAIFVLAMIFRYSDENAHAMIACRALAAKAVHGSRARYDACYRDHGGHGYVSVIEVTRRM